MSDPTLERDPLRLPLSSRVAVLSDALAFGLGAGLYFEYWQRPKETPSRFFIGHSRHLVHELEARVELWRGDDRRGAIAQALRANALAMNLDRAPTKGIMGMELLAEDFENWPAAPDWELCARTAAKTIAQTGSLHRRHYVEFLKEGALWFDAALHLVKPLDEIAGEWDELGVELASLTEGDFSRASRMMRRLAMREEYYWGQVLDWTAGSDDVG